MLFGDPIPDIVPTEYRPRLGPDRDGTDAVNTGAPRIHKRLGHHVLDEILSYSNNACVIVLPRVCRYWRDKIGTRSPQLWRMLLDRHGWPATRVNGNNGNDDIDGANDSPLLCVSRFRDAFIAHYKVVRDIKASVNAIRYISGGGAIGSIANAGAKIRRESAIQIFKCTKGAPFLERNEWGDQCIVRIWSCDTNDDVGSPRALAVYPEDCTLRLFEVVCGNGNDGVSNSSTGVKCRQIVCLRVAPPSILRKKDSCLVVSMDLNDAHVACLVKESLKWDKLIDQIRPVNPWLVAVSREDVV